MKHQCRLYFIFTSIIIYSVKIQSEVTKCCPIGSVLDTFSSSCAENETNWDAYNIENVEMPYCDHQLIDVFKDGKYFELNGCIDKNEHDEFVTIQCSDNPKIGVHLMNKCCPIGYSYDHIERSCIENPKTHMHFKKVFKNSVVVFNNSVPICSDDEVYVEYHSTVDNITFFGDVIEVNHNVLSLDKFCIEDLVNINENQSNELNVIVRSCQPNSVCNGITCMRRCCQADQILERNPLRCEPHPTNTNLKPIFYDLDFPLVSDKIQTKIQIEGKIDMYFVIKLRLLSLSVTNGYYCNMELIRYWSFFSLICIIFKK